MISLKFHSILSTILELSEVNIDLKNINIKDLLKRVEKDNNLSLTERFISSDGSVTNGILILLNGKNITSIDGFDTICKGINDIIDIFPPGTGG